MSWLAASGGGFETLARRKKIACLVDSAQRRSS
jgi:hypothetical protein